MNLNKEVFVCLDCEMTGLDPEKDQIIEIAIAKFTFSEVLESFESLVDPLCSIPESSTAIHHITTEMIQGKPRIESVLPAVLKMASNHVIIGHGVQYDIEMIARAAQKHCIPTNIRNNKFLDTLRLARLYGESPVNSLESLRKHFNIEDEGAHRAMSDVIVNIDVFKNLCRGFNRLDQVFSALSKPIMMKTMPLGKHKGRSLKEIPMDYLLWAAKKEFDQDLLFSIRSEIKRRKNGNLFAQAANPFAAL
ncbi:MAG: putative quorum-sensing-regulated virulence factor [Parachlamydiaceae bacterium]